MFLKTYQVSDNNRNILTDFFQSKSFSDGIVNTSKYSLFFTFLTLTYRNYSSIKYKQVEKKLIKPVSKDKHSIWSKECWKPLYSILFELVLVWHGYL